jgi:hypothetical protein
MKYLTVQEFLIEIETALKNYFSSYRLQTILQTEKSFKANIHLDMNTFIAVRYNARNKRMDFALIMDNQRSFGYDNLKDWHYHPQTNPAEHILCKEPSIKKIISDIKDVFDLI